MDNKPEGTPNPLNPGNQLDANPAGPETTAPQPVQPVAVDNPAQVTTAAPKKKSKTGLVVAVLACLLVAIGCGVAAMLLAFNSNGDPVNAAIVKMLRNDTPSNVTIDGKIAAELNSDDLPFSNAELKINSQFVQNSMINKTSVEASVTPVGGVSDITLGIDEVYSSDGSIYVKIKGIGNLLKDFASDSQTVGLDTLGVVSAIEDEWLKVTAEEMESVTGNITNSTSDSTACLINLGKDVKNNANSIAKFYDEHKFITATTENVNVASTTGNPVYKLDVDSDKMVEFLNAVQETELFNKMSTCMGRSNGKIDTDSLIEAMSFMPAVYVEVDGNHNFTRFYTQLEIPSEDGEDTLGTLDVDFKFAYPNSVNVAEPTEYSTLTQLMTKLYSTSL